MYRELYKFTPPNWGKTFFQEDNQAITESLAAMSMNYFAFFPALNNPAINPHADVTGYFANPAGPDGEQHAALGGQGISVVCYSKNQEEAMKFLEWFIKDDDPEALGRARRLHREQGDPRVRGVPQRDALQRGLLPVDVHGEGLLGGAGVRRAADPDQRPGLSRTSSAARARPRRRSTASPRTGRRPSRSTAAADGRLTTGPGGDARPHQEKRPTGNGDAACWPDLTLALPGGGPGLERSRDPEPVHHSDDRVPHHLQRLSADLLARLLLHRLPRLGERAGAVRRAAELPRAPGRPQRLAQLHGDGEVRDRLGDRAGGGRLRPRACC